MKNSPDKLKNSKDYPISHPLLKPQDKKANGILDKILGMEDDDD